jgi:hypothetical protein
MGGAERFHRAEIDRHGSVDDALEEPGTELDGRSPTDDLARIGRLPPEVGLLCNTKPRIVPFARGRCVIGVGDRRGEETLHLIAQVADGPPATAGGNETELRHEAAQSRSELQQGTLGSDGFARDPDQEETGIAAVRESDVRMGGDAEREIPVSAKERIATGFAMRQTDLDENPGHEAEGSCRARVFGLDRQRLLEKPPC